MRSLLRRSSMFTSLGRAGYRFRWLILALAVAFVAFGAIWGSRVSGTLQPGGFTNPDSESARAEQVLDRDIGRDAGDVLVLYRSGTHTVDDPAFRGAVTSTVVGLPSRLVDSSLSYWSTHDTRFVSKDRHTTYVVIRLTGTDDGARMTQLDTLQPRLDAPGLTEQVGGTTAVNRDVSAQTSKDLERAEMLSLPIVFVLLVIVFGGLIAAAMPLAVGGIAILGAFVALRLIASATDVSIYALNVVTLLGLGLAIDYGLFVVSRYREEMGRGADVPTALANTMATAGRTVAISGVTVTVSLAGLTLFPQMFLRSMGFGGMAAVAVAALSALVVLPALLAVVGRRIDALSFGGLLRRVRRRPAATTSPRHEAGGTGAWARIAHSVVRRPVAYATAVVVLLLLLGSPFLRISFGGVDERVLPTTAVSRVVQHTIDTDFPAQQTAPVLAAVRLPDDVASPSGRSALAAYVQRLEGIDGVTGARVTGASGHLAKVSVDYRGEANSAHARDLVREVRDTAPPPGATVQVGGTSADLVDLLHGIGATLPWVALLVGLATFVLLFLAFGSVVLPLKAVLMNVFSLGATFGALVWIFQEGHLSGLLRFTATGQLDSSQPVLVLMVVFGLSMDYEVFLLSRVREQYDLTGDNTTAVATGLQRSGRIITSAALLLIVVVAAFSTSSITFLKLIGVGMVIAIAVDATLIRVLLVPATMRLLGRANWWAPRPLRRLYARWNLSERDGPMAPPRSDDLDHYDEARSPVTSHS
ncbi:MAG TPA: MMPL family transporter [Streptosporangiales bacterium]